MSMQRSGAHQPRIRLPCGRRLALWPRGDVLLALDLCAGIDHNTLVPQAPQLALHIARQWAKNCSRRDATAQWRHGKSDDDWNENADAADIDTWLALCRATRHPALCRAPTLCEALFWAADGAFQTAELGAPRQMKHHHGRRVPVALLCCALALSARRHRQRQSIVEFVRQHAASFCAIFALSAGVANECAQQQQLREREPEEGRSQTHYFPKALELDDTGALPLQVLRAMDALFEGAALPNGQRGEDNKVNALPLSKLVHDNVNEITLSGLVQLLSDALQRDLFRLLDEECPSSSAHAHQQKKAVATTRRSLTAVRSAPKRRLSVDGAARLELLTSGTLRGTNLRLANARPGASLVFHALALHTAVIDNCEEAGPIVLGPVAGVLVLRRLRKVAVSALCAHIRLEGCEHVTLFCQTTGPILVAKCAHIRVAPYNTFYDGLAHELAFAGMQMLSAQANTFERTIELMCFGMAKDASSESCVSKLPPEQFYIQPTPFRQTQSGPLYQQFVHSVPAEYWECWKHRRERAREQAQRLSQTQMLEMCPLDRQDLHYLLTKIKP